MTGSAGSVPEGSVCNWWSDQEVLGYHVTYPIMDLMLPVCCPYTDCD